MKKMLVSGLVLLLAGCSAVICEKENSAETASYDYSFSSEDLTVSDLSDATYIVQSDYLENIEIDEPGTYVLSGDINGSVIVDLQKTEEAVLVLDNVNIKSSFASIYIKEADKVTVSLPDGTENCLSDTSSAYKQIDSNTVDAVIFSKTDLVFNGTGSLTVKANYNHAIVSKDSLTVIDGSYSIDAVGQGICGKDSLKIRNGSFVISSNTGLKSDNEDDDGSGWIYIENGDFSISSEKDAIHAEDNVIIRNGNFVISSGDDGIHSEKYLIVDDGNIDIQKSYEGLEGQYIELNGGEINIVSDDDGINAVDYSVKTGSDDDFEDGVQMNNDGIPNQDSNSFQTNDEDSSGMNIPDAPEAFDDSEIPVKPEDSDFSSNEKPGSSEQTPMNSGNQNQMLQNGKTDPQTDLEPADSERQDDISAAERPFGRNSDENIIDGKDFRNMSENSFGSDDKKPDRADGQNFMQMDIKAPGMSGLFGNATDCYIEFNGADVNIDAGGDGVDSNGKVEINSGTVIIETSSTGGDAAFDYETSAVINGGEFIAIGPSEMAESFDDESGQYSSLIKTENYGAGSVIEIADEEGDIAFSIKAKYQFDSILVSSSKIKNSSNLIVSIS